MDEVLRYYARSEAARWYANGGPCAQELTARIESHVGGGAHCVLVSNCTAGLMVALRATLGTATAHRRLVVTPAYTFTATACAIAWAGFEPLFVDVDPVAWQLDAGQLRAALDAHGDQVAGVMATSTFGTAAPAATRRAWREACADHGVPLVLDSAPGFGAEDAQGRLLGGLGDTEVFSFHATKPFAIGEGGAILTPDPAVAERAARLINFGLEPGSRSSAEAGLNAKLSELHAAVGLAALDRLPGVLAERRRLARELKRRLRRAPLAYQEQSERSTWQYFQTLAPSAATRTAVAIRAVELGVEMRTLHDPALHRQPAFAAAARHGDLAVTDDLAGRSLSLPLANSLTDPELDRIAAVAHRAQETPA